MLSRRGRQRRGRPLEDCVVLYLEDDDATAYLFQITLEQENVNPRLFRVTQGEQALAFLHRLGAYEEASRPDLLLLDLNLPGKTGFDILAEVRQNPKFDDLVIVAFSSSHSHTDRNRAFELGADEYL